MRLTDTEPKSNSDTRRTHAAWRDAVPALALRVVTQGSLIWRNPGRPTSALGVGWALSPLLAVAWLAWNQLRVMWRADELQRLVQLKAMAIGFGVMSILLLGVGLLHAAEIGDLAQQTQIALIVGVLAWIAVQPTQPRGIEMYQYKILTERDARFSGQFDLDTPIIRPESRTHRRQSQRAALRSSGRPDEHHPCS